MGREAAAAPCFLLVFLCLHVCLHVVLPLVLPVVGPPIGSISATVCAVGSISTPPPEKEPAAEARRAATSTTRRSTEAVVVTLPVRGDQSREAMLKVYAEDNSKSVSVMLSGAADVRSR